MNQNKEATQHIPWNDRASTGILRVGLYSGFARMAWRYIAEDISRGKTDWANIVWFAVCVFFILTSAIWTIRKGLERHRRTCVVTEQNSGVERQT